MIRAFIFQVWFGDVQELKGLKGQVWNGIWSGDPQLSDAFYHINLKVWTSRFGVFLLLVFFSFSRVNSFPFIDGERISEPSTW